jgi:hypothetical protein
MSLFVAQAFNHYFSMWNERDPAQVRSHLDQAVTEDFIFCDPQHFHTGRDALEANVLGFRADHPLVSLEVASGVDAHHNRVRYEWHILKGTRVLFRGFDVATLADSGLIERIDGFFGSLPSRGE